MELPVSPHYLVQRHGQYTALTVSAKVYFSEAAFISVVFLSLQLHRVILALHPLGVIECMEILREQKLLLYRIEVIGLFSEVEKVKMKGKMGFGYKISRTQDTPQLIHTKQMLWKCAQRLHFTVPPFHHQMFIEHLLCGKIF